MAINTPDASREYYPKQNKLNKEDFKSCFDQYFDPLRNYLYYRSGDSELATDIAQEVFMKPWEKQVPLEPEKIKGLLYKMAGDQFINHIRKNKVADNYMNTLELNLRGDNPEDTLRFKELKSNYEKALGELTEKQRTVFLMSRIEELTYKEIAERLSLSVKAVEKRMSIAIAVLKQRLMYND